MLAYSGKGRYVEETISLSQLVKAMLHLLEVSISKNVALNSDFAENLPAIKADPTQIGQVVMNLMTNASEAISENNGVISINANTMNCDQQYLTGTYLGDDLTQGVYVYVEVEDTGSGMNDETKERLFDPFFSTKFTGRGLGLSAVLGIVRSHQGAIKLHSEAGVGTTIRVLFPAVAQSASGVIEPAEKTQLWEGSGTILIVDDEAAVLAVTAQMLEQKGFKVLTAADGRECIDIFKDYKEEIICVLLDLTMPDMDGGATYPELRKIKDDVKVILCSGYNHQDVAARFAGKGLTNFIQKPYGVDELYEKLYEVVYTAQEAPR
jgi:CheY-like chemotaxis protein/two-component sensor histidine kinase